MLSRESCCLLYFSTLQSPKWTLCNRTQIFCYSYALCNFLARDATFSKKTFPMLTVWIAVSNITSLTIPCAAWRQCQEFLIFLLWIFWRSFSSDNFCKNFGFLAGVVSKIFAIKNALQPNNQFLRNAFRKSCLLPHLYRKNHAQKLAPRNRIHVLCKFNVFAKKDILQTFFPR